MWTEHSDCIRVIRETWAKPVNGCPMVVLSNKLKCLKSELKVWNKQVFGDVNLKVELALFNLDSIQKQAVVTGYYNALYDQEKKAQLDLQQVLSMEESFWKQKSNMDFFAHGDCNTSFFHRVAKIRKTFKQMTTLQKDDIRLDSQAEIESHVLDFY